MTLFCLGMFAASLLLSFILTRYVRDAATLRGWVSEPANDRHLHRTPLPRFGGVAIFFSFLLVSIFGLLLNRFYLHLHFAFSRQSLLTILTAGFLVFLLGVYDDVRPVGPYRKFSIEVIAAVMLYAGNLRILNLPVLFGHHQFSALVGLPLTVVWVLAITNAFNLIDGLDGLAAGSALFSTIVVFVVALLSHASLVSLLTLSLAGAILGFLRFNFNPATIFLGDCGSLFIGFMLSALALLGAQKSPTIIAVAIPVVSFGLPILETTLSVIRRFISGRPVFTADREHIHHKLLQLGFSHRQVVITLYAVSALFALLSLFLLWPTGSGLGLVLAVVGSGVWMGVQHLGYLEFGELRRVAAKTIDQRQTFINNLAIRRASEELKVAREYDQILRILSAAFGANDFDAIELRQGFVPVDLFDLSEVSQFQTVSVRGQEPCLRWKKTGSYFSSELVSAWNLTIDLVTSRNRRCGCVTFYRRYNGRDLQLDINLLTSIFQTSLADGLQRVSTQTVQYMQPLKEGPLVSAHVS